MTSTSLELWDTSVYKKDEGLHPVYQNILCFSQISAYYPSMSLYKVLWEAPVGIPKTWKAWSCHERNINLAKVVRFRG